MANLEDTIKSVAVDITSHAAEKGFSALALKFVEDKLREFHEAVTKVTEEVTEEASEVVTGRKGRAGKTQA